MKQGGAVTALAYHDGDPDSPNRERAAPTLFELPDPLPAYQRGSATSKDAARDFAKKARTVREMVHLYVLARGSHGATYTEIMDGLHLCSGTVCGRLAELKESGDVVLTKERRHKKGVVVERRFYGKAA